LTFKDDSDIFYGKGVAEMKGNAKRHIVLPFLIFFLAFPITPSLSQPPSIGRYPGAGMKFWRGETSCWAASELSLSQDQAKGLDSLQQTFFREVQLLRVQLFSKRLELRELLTNPNSKTEAIRSKSSEILEYQAKLEEKSIDYLLKVKGLLTPEQLRSWCPELDLPGPRRMMQGPDATGPFPPRRSPLPEGGKPE
jgi:Spy/CpxP family protein refolding chaperone